MTSTSAMIGVNREPGFSCHRFEPKMRVFAVSLENQPTPSEVPTAPASAKRNVTRNEIVILGEGLPAAPRIMAQLVELLADPDTDTTDIASILRSDPALTARAIRMSNTIIFGPVGADVTDIEEALTRVGVANVLGLVGAAGVSGWVAEPLPVYGIDIDTFQRSSLCHAQTAEHLADRLGEDFRAAYIVGLLRGLGMIVLDRAAGVLAEPPRFTPEKYRSYDEFELEVFGVTSREATRILLEEWGFPAPIVQALDLHLLDKPDAVSNRLACIVNVAGEVAAAAGHGLPGDDAHWLAAPGKYETLGVTEDFWKDLCAAAKARSAGISATLAAK
jgi:HD-like signal output (HDOD) protein